MSDLVETMRRKLLGSQPIPVHERVVLERLLANLSVSQCARRMGWPPSTWQRIEDGRRTISEAEIPLMAKIMGVTDTRLRGLQATLLPGRNRPGRPAKLLAAA